MSKTITIGSQDSGNISIDVYVNFLEKNDSSGGSTTLEVKIGSTTLISAYVGAKTSYTYFEDAPVNVTIPTLATGLSPGNKTVSVKLNCGDGKYATVSNVVMKITQLKK